MVSNKALIEQAVSILNDAVKEFNPIKTYVLVSGGNDSTTCAHLAKTYGPPVDAFAHINTGIGVEETRIFTREFAKWLNTPLIEKQGPRTYEDLVREHGFPGPGAHRYMYIWLKERALRELRREAQEGQNRRVVFITGVRTAESRRRMAYVEPIRREGNTVWVAPIHHFTTEDLMAYRQEHELPRNQVVELLHMSGECLCGAFANPKNKELEWLELWYPDVAQRIRRLEQEAKELGHTRCFWGPGGDRTNPPPGPLCQGCQLPMELEP